MEYLDADAEMEVDAGEGRRTEERGRVGGIEDFCLRAEEETYKPGD